MAKPSAPLWLENAMGPAGGKTGENDALSRIAGSVLTRPMQFGPIIRTPAARALSRSRASCARPCSPVSPKPALMTMTAGTPFAMQSSSARFDGLRGHGNNHQIDVARYVPHRWIRANRFDLLSLWVDWNSSPAKAARGEVVEDFRTDSAATPSSADNRHRPRFKERAQGVGSDERDRWAVRCYDSTASTFGGIHWLILDICPMTCTRPAIPGTHQPPDKMSRVHADARQPDERECRCEHFRRRKIERIVVHRVSDRNARAAPGQGERKPGRT